MPKTLPRLRVGERFGRLRVLIPEGKKINAKGKLIKGKHVLCICDCGKLNAVNCFSLRNSLSRSCGCLTVEAVRKRNMKHGKSKTKTYQIWRAMKNRCFAKDDAFYENYGGRGITMCDKWRYSFITFLNDMGECPKGFSIERIDNEKGYCPENCKWATPVEQANNRRNNSLISFKGRTLTIAQWERELGFKAGQLGQRLYKGWSVERALTTPIKLRRTNSPA